MLARREEHARRGGGCKAVSPRRSVHRDQSGWTSACISGERFNAEASETFSVPSSGSSIAPMPLPVPAALSVAGPAPLSAAKTLRANSRRQLRESCAFVRCRSGRAVRAARRIGGRMTARRGRGDRGVLQSHREIELKGKGFMRHTFELDAAERGCPQDPFFRLDRLLRPASEAIAASSKVSV